MIYFNAFLFCGLVCLVGQIILDNTKLTPGHITALFVVIGAFLDIFGIYDRIILWAGGGACVPITSYGIMGLFMGIFALTASGISSAIIFSVVLCFLFQPKS